MNPLTEGRKSVSFRQDRDLRHDLGDSKTHPAPLPDRAVQKPLSHNRQGKALTTAASEKSLAAFACKDRDLRRIIRATIPIKHDLYLRSCARIRGITLTALMTRLADLIGQDQLVSSILDDENQIKKSGARVRIDIRSGFDVG